MQQFAGYVRRRIRTGSRTGRAAAPPYGSVKAGLQTVGGRMFWINVESRALRANFRVIQEKRFSK